MHFPKPEIILIFTMIRIVNIDDDKKWQSILRLSFSDYTIFPSYSGKAGISMVKSRNPDVVLLNQGLADMKYRDVLRRLKEIPGSPPVIILGNCKSARDIVASIKNGAVDFVIKPYDMVRLKDSIIDAVRAVPSFSGGGGYIEHPVLKEIIGESAAIRNFKRDLFRYALADASIFITGETGTGKGLAARLVHKISGRRDGPYCVMDAGGIPVTIIESQLYGTEKGAYTDAVSNAGYFEKADRGTLFIDEIGELSVYAQSKLLRILEEKEIYRIGGRYPVPIDVRIVTATNIDVSEAIKERTFRMDLFYRISTLSLYVPPLRDRLEDIPMLVNYFLSGTGPVCSISDTALEKLNEYSWPGNIRELKNVIMRAEIISGNRGIESRDIIFDPIWH